MERSVAISKSAETALTIELSGPLLVRLRSKILAFSHAGTDPNPLSYKGLEARVRIELTHKGFADLVCRLAGVVVEHLGISQLDDIGAWLTEVARGYLEYEWVGCHR
jgi:hypothetical protein